MMLTIYLLTMIVSYSGPTEGAHYAFAAYNTPVECDLAGYAWINADPMTDAHARRGWYCEKRTDLTAADVMAYVNLGAKK